MSFNRFRVQTYIETALGCTNPEHWHSYRQKVESYKLPNQDESNIKTQLLQDGEDLFYKGIYSLIEGISSVSMGRHSWAVVMFYYSIFYFLRSSLASKGYAFIKNQSAYIWEIRANKTPLKKNSKKYRNDHVAIINLYYEIVGNNDLLSTNTIEGRSVYLWLMDLRNQVNYRQREFREPDYIPEYNFAKNSIKSDNFSGLLNSYYNDNVPIFCFDSDHACIAAPLKRAVLTKNDLIHGGIASFSPEKFGSMISLLSKSISQDCKVFELLS